MAKHTSLVTADFGRRNTLLLSLYVPGNAIRNIDAYTKEFLSLIKTAAIPYSATLCMKLRTTTSSHLLTKGKLEELTAYCHTNHIEEVYCSVSLSPLQERNLSEVLGCHVYDRTQLILTIFKQAAHTAEGKTQVEIAELEYLKTRLAGRGAEMMQQAGHIGTRGPGETVKEILKRTYADKIRQAKKQLDKLEQVRETQRRRRLESHTPLVSLVGYTNSGKSSLLNALTKSDVLTEDKLFATLDTTTRELFIGPGKKILLSDTVGFISDLPHHLIDAFKSTLDELRYADLLLHVVDASNSMWQDHIHVAEQIIKELGVEKPSLYVFNKMDAVADQPSLLPRLALYSPQVLTSTLLRDGVEPLRTYLASYRFAQYSQ